MTPSADRTPPHPRPRRAIFFPVVLATIFLTIIGMTGGFVLGERDREAERAARQQGAQQAGPADVTSPAPSGPLCPPETLRIAVTLHGTSDLRQVFKIVTDNGTVVWICQDSAGDLYYQGKTGGPDQPLVQNKNGLFLPNATKTGRSQYRVVDQRGNIFTVDPSKLQLFHTDGTVEVHRVVTVG